MLPYLQVLVGSNLEFSWLRDSVLKDIKFPTESFIKCMFILVPPFANKVVIKRAFENSALFLELFST